MSNAESFRIILRYGLDPLNGLDENVLRLLEFVDDSDIQEVMFLIAPEERSQGHITLEEAAPWIEAIQRIKPSLTERNVDISVNPWTTIYHEGRGRTLHPGQDFRLMVGETGADNCISACPLCENWQAYLINYFSLLTRKIRPVAIWIEDDWRLHNHGEEMGYGGCFCETCIERFGEKAGEPVTREQVLANVLKEGAPHPWRALWLEHARESLLLEPAAKLADALRKQAPDMRIGLMSSIPDDHSVEGRDWNALTSIWSGDGRYLIRPHMPPYTEEPPIKTTPAFSRHTLANLDRDRDIYPELENSPRCGPYSGSHAYSIWEIQNAILYGAQGITINHFDNMGMNTYYDRGFGKALAEKRPIFDALMPLGLDDRKARGVQILFSPDVALHAHSGNASSLNGLVTDSAAWSPVFYALGISHGFTKQIPNNPDTVVAICDQTVCAFSDAEVERILKLGVMLDLPSARMLIERGFGELIGVDSIGETSLRASAYSIEEADEYFFGSLEGGVRARMCLQRCADPIGVPVLNAGTQVVSRALTAGLEELFPVSGIFRNRLGGRVFTASYPLGHAQFYMAYFNRVRQQLMRNVVFALGSSEAGYTVASEHPLHLHALNTNYGILCGVTNVIYDTCRGFTVSLNTRDVLGANSQIMDSKGNWQTIQPLVAEKGGISTLGFDCALAPLETALILLSQRK